MTDLRERRFVGGSLDGELRLVAADSTVVEVPHVVDEEPLRVP